MALGTKLKVTMGKIRVAPEPTTIICPGLGSGIAIVAYDPETEVSGAAHVVLPHLPPGHDQDHLGRFADTAVRELVSQLEQAGADRNRLIFVCAGGARPFNAGDEADFADFGRRNAEVVEQALYDAKAKVFASDIGGSAGRTLYVNTDTGEVRVVNVHGSERLLGNLKVA